MKLHSKPCYVLRPLGLSLNFAPCENSEAVHPETRVPLSTRVFPKYLDHEKKAYVTGSMYPRTSTVLRTTPNYRLATVNHAVRPPVGKDH